MKNSWVLSFRSTKLCFLCLSVCSVSPVLVYEPCYPRRKHFRVGYFLEKVRCSLPQSMSVVTSLKHLRLFGCPLQVVIATGLLTCGYVVLDQHIYPVLANIDELPPAKVRRLIF